MHIQPHSQARNYEEIGGARCSFWNPKKCPDFENKGLNCVHLYCEYLGQKFPKYFPLVPLFLVFLTNCLSKCSRYTTFPQCPKKFLVVHFNSGIVLFAKHSIVNVWQCSEYVSVSITAQWTVQWLHALYCIWHGQNSGIFSTLFFSDICRHIQSYSGLLRHVHTYWYIIKAYSAPCITLAYSKPCHILSPDIFRTEGLFKTLWNDDQA